MSLIFLDRETHDLQLVVTARQDRQIWASALRSAVLPEIRNAGRGEKRPSSGASFDTLVATGVITALGAFTRTQYEQLKRRAQQAGSSLPRLDVRAYGSFTSAMLNGNGKLLRVTDKIRRDLRNALAHYVTTYEAIRGAADDPTSSNLIDWALRGLRDDIGGPKFYTPGLVSQIVPTAKPLTPAY